MKSFMLSAQLTTSWCSANWLEDLNLNIPVNTRECFRLPEFGATPYINNCNWNSIFLCAFLYNCVKLGLALVEDRSKTRTHLRTQCLQCVNLIGKGDNFNTKTMFSRSLRIIKWRIMKCLQKIINIFGTAELRHGLISEVTEGTTRLHPQNNIHERHAYFRFINDIIGHVRFSQRWLWRVLSSGI
jgi:hypothetical protein